MIPGTEILTGGAEFHHVGVACRDLSREQQLMTALGYQPVGETFTDPRQGVTGLFLEGSGPRLELLAPLQGSTVLDPWLAVNAKLYHLAYEVPALGQAAAAAKAAGARQVSRPEPAVAFDGRPISFFMLRNRLLIELIEAPARLSRE